MRNSRFWPGASVGALGLLVTMAIVLPASGATNGAAQLRAKQFATGRHAPVQAAESEDGGDEAGVIRARGEFETAIAAAPAQVVPSRGLSAAIAAAAALPVRGGSWSEITAKPFINDPINRGFNFGVGWGNVTGRMTAFTAAGGAVYAASASGGVWRSTDMGGHWTAVSAGLPRLAIGAIATSPDGSVWAGTGEANNASENQYGVGVYRLANGSSTWARVGGHELDGAGSYRLRWIHGFVYAATSHGLYRRAVTAADSTAWQVVLKPDPNPSNSPYRTSFITDVIAVPGSNGERILAVDGWPGYTTPAAIRYNGFYVGSGAAGSFSRITPHGDINPNTIGRSSFSTSGGWLYAVVQDTSTDTLYGQGAFVSKSGNPAGPWTKIADSTQLANSDSALSPPNPPDLTSYFPGVQADYNQYIVADPNNRRHVYLGLEEVYETTNTGGSWNTVGPYWNFDISCQLKTGDPYNCPGTTHPDQHAGFVYGGQFWAGNDGGVWSRPLSRHKRGHWTNHNAGLDTLQYYSAASGNVSGGTAYWGGLQDNGETFFATGMSRVEQAFTGDGGDTIVDPHNGLRAVVEYVDQDLYLTTDGGVSLTEISPSCPLATEPPNPCDPNPRFIAPIEQDVRNPDHWVSGGQYVWQDHKSWHTVCAGPTCDWKKVYDTGDGHQVTALAADGHTMYAGWCGACNPATGVPFGRGLATNFGGSWHELSLAGLPNRYITSIAADPANPAHVYISFGSYSRRWIPDAGHGHVFETTDGGETWTDVSGNLPDAPVYHVVIRGGQLVVGAEVGAFISDRSHPGQWARLGTGLPNVTVWDVSVTAAGSRLVAGTHGRGQWVVRLP
ncbi:MAG: hypothetical protein QOG02_2116 [Gaiellales bacterium]|nr:hypothetical protein [Gaiellales bacterium]